ncbi:MAG: hypothetical protein ACLUJ0_16225 [Ruthenibacterium lactatiformans]|uniref:hypothetical protein n=1 Tax=Ruthenibacterium lactatiformans TaxID=1550024 RepID=UPI0039962517
MEHEFERQLRALAIERRPEACLGCGFEHGCSVHGCAVIHAAVNHLAAYEETRLEPEDMKKAFNEDATLKLAGQILGMSPDRLLELAQAKKKGRLVVLPCDVGDKLYDVTLGEVREKIVISLSMLLSKSVNHLVIHAENFRNAVTSYELQDIGKTVFLTREAAEAALDAMRGENNA